MPLTRLAALATLSPQAGIGKSRRRFLLSAAEALVEAFVRVGEIEQQTVGREALAVALLEQAAEIDEFARAHHVDPRERAAGIGREAEAEDRADIRLAHVGQNLLLEAAGRLQRLDTEQAQFQFVD